MMEEQQLELLTFHEMWEDKMKDYDEKADDLLYQLNRQHMMDMQSQEDIIRLGLMEKRLRPSKTLVDLRDELKNFVQQRMYADAEHVQKKIVQREAEELHEFEVEQERKLQERLLAVAERLRVERGAVEQRLAMNREELLAERRQDFDALVKRHSAALRGQEQATALIISRAQDCIHRQVKAYIKDPVKTGLELVHLSETVLGRRSRGDHSAVEWGASGRQGTSWRSSAHRQITERVPSPGQTPLRAVVAARPPWQD
ncbi:hypothetical protein DQ04_05631030 [Trypanosoma grayi]|uniref:hypothetical protein n=1 Tax=Trypanosoma grayi TaxID=71804 RepID=UPI0004F441E5|nr:hypothetical protein DQ04_05631030 [Trypanosoma grayi]KEG09198.1 hypothetical protein DQ04_05631030 [Trypanosoma grayi]